MRAGECDGLITRGRGDGGTRGRGDMGTRDVGTWGRGEVSSFRVLCVSVVILKEPRSLRQAVPDLAIAVVAHRCDPSRSHRGLDGVARLPRANSWRRRNPEWPRRSRDKRLAGRIPSAPTGRIPGCRGCRPRKAARGQRVQRDLCRCVPALVPAVAHLAVPADWSVGGARQRRFAHSDRPASAVVRPASASRSVASPSPVRVLVARVR